MEEKSNKSRCVRWNHGINKEYGRARETGSGKKRVFHQEIRKEGLKWNRTWNRQLEGKFQKERENNDWGGGGGEM